ncbi:hypothetical protein GCM10009527_047440 [Actinomadura nitritigenes]
MITPTREVLLRVALGRDGWTVTARSEGRLGLLRMGGYPRCGVRLPLLACEPLRPNGPDWWVWVDQDGRHKPIPICPGNRMDVAARLIRNTLRKLAPDQGL